ncbi:hypothetical protein C0992_007816 [Termitomyces sp. T32_za158]|nr:hypothetical protein C0992_007816 [Termitomyces sp. T32_za158]
MDSRFKHWEKNLPPEYRLSQDGAVHDLTPTESAIINCQRYNLHTWYLLCRIKLYIAALTGARRLRTFLTDVLEIGQATVLTSMKLIKFQCDTYDSALCSGPENVHPTFPGSIWFFEGCYSLFEAAVALITTLARYPWSDKMPEAKQLVDRAIGVLTQVAALDKGKRRGIVCIAAEVLRSLRQEIWWRTQASTVSDDLLPPVHNTGIASTYRMPTRSTTGNEQYIASMTDSHPFETSGMNNQVMSQTTIASVSGE